MTENLRKYFIRYSVELVVIFTGITLSFAFDEWRKERDDRAEERRVLLSLQRDLARKLNELMSDSSGLATLGGVADSLRTQLYQTRVGDERYVRWVSLTWGTNYLFNPTTAAYKIVTQTGKLDLLTDDSLTSSIVELHEYAFPALTKAYARHEAFDDARLQPLSRNIPWNRMKDASAFKVEVTRLLASAENRDVLYWKSYMCSTHSYDLSVSLKKLRITLRHIERELLLVN